MNPRRANPGRTAVSAFTLIELMVVIGLMMIVLAIGVPRMVQGNRSPLGESLNAVMEACAAARRQAILTGSTSRVTIRARMKASVFSSTPAPEGRGQRRRKGQRMGCPVPSQVRAPGLAAGFTTMCPFLLFR